MGSVIIMGRKTFESIIGYLGKPLPGRISVVVSRSGYEHDGALTCPDIESALEKARELATEQNLGEIFIGGGAQIYELAMPYTDRIYLTKVHIDVEGDTYLNLPEDQWHKTANKNHEGDPAYSFITLEKKTG